MKKPNLKERYGFDKTSTQWLLPGGDILKYIGLSVLCLNFKKTESGTWEHTQENVTIEAISGYDPLTSTYSITWTDKEGATYTSRIIPEGWSFGDPEVTGEMKRFIPLSLHCSLVETEEYWSRVKGLSEKRPLGIDQVQQLSDTKSDQSQTLGNVLNIVAVMQNPLEPAEDILCFRVHRLKLSHLHKDKYTMTLTDKTGGSVIVNISGSTWKTVDSGIEYRVSLVDLQE